MQTTDVPDKFPVPFANEATAGYIRPIPEASQINVQAGAASLVDGFPPVTFLPVGAGGTPPWGQDFNGLLNQVTLWNRWASAGAPNFYDSSFATSIGGYPKGAMLSAVGLPGVFWVSTSDDNLSDPDAGGANWIGIGSQRTRIITASGAFVMLATDDAVGLNRTAGLALSSSTLLAPAFTGKVVTVQDLAGNFSDYPVTITPPAGDTIAGLSTFVMNVDRQTCAFRYYGSNLWGLG